MCKSESPIVGQEFAQWIPVGHDEVEVTENMSTVLEYLQWIEKNMGPRDLAYFRGDIQRIMLRLSSVVDEAAAMREQ